MTLPIALIAAVATQVLCQLYKVAYYSAKDGAFSFSYFFTSGGMPSAHSAFVTALATSIAFSSGITSNLFAAAAVFGFIVMYDAFRLRGTVEKLTIIVRRLLEERAATAKFGAIGGVEEVDAVSHAASAAAGIEVDEGELPKMLGHTVPEIAIGIVIGVVLGGGFTLLLRHLGGG